ncbi:MAG TPA: type II toxin-antitoxin system VapC family toxin [Flavobacteriaceae bacterium]|nr:type II toxin-antitoxin system VapC family toxin [Flavobacteriaceae bacterium]
MSGTKLFLDTNIILYLLDGDRTLADFLYEKQLYVSIITELELLSFQELTSEDKTHIRGFLSECSIININEAIKERTIEVRQKYGIKLPDNIITATSTDLNIPYYYNG